MRKHQMVWKSKGTMNIKDYLSNRCCHVRTVQCELVSQHLTDFRVSAATADSISEACLMVIMHAALRCKGEQVRIVIRCES